VRLSLLKFVQLLALNKRNHPMPDDARYWPKATAGDHSKTESIIKISQCVAGQIIAGAR
jgi:hypothetical protein